MTGRGDSYIVWFTLSKDYSCSGWKTDYRGAKAETGKPVRKPGQWSSERQGQVE